MRTLGIKIIPFLLLLMILLIIPVLGACGDDDEGSPDATSTIPPTSTTVPDTASPVPTQQPVQERKIIIGNLTDLSGHAAGAFALVNEAIADLIDYFNDENLIPGVELELLTYDTGYEPAKDIPGYEWLKERDADLIIAQPPHSPITLKRRADDDKIVVFSLTTDPALLDPPGWVFTLNTDAALYSTTMLKWVAENDWDYQSKGPAILAALSYVGPFYDQLQAGAKAYCEAHPDQFTWEGAYQQSFGAFDWSTSVARVKDADYILAGTVGVMSYGKELKNQQSDAKLLCGNWTTASLGVTVDALGEAYMNGQLFIYPNRWWNEDYEIPNLAKQLLTRYRSEDELEKAIHQGSSYLGGIEQSFAVLNIIKETVENVGPEGFSSQALYDTATSFSMQYGGCEKWGYSDTKRTTWEYLGMYEFSEDEGTLVRKDQNWLPIVEVP